MASSSDVHCGVDLYLIGKARSGKSSTGNTILGRQAFLNSDSKPSDIMRTAVAWTRRHGPYVKVVDGSGLVDTDVDQTEKVRHIVSQLNIGYGHCPRGFHAFLIVVQYGNQLADEEQTTLDTLKELFGPCFIKDHCILAFTHGENFDQDNQEMTFEKWCGEQTGRLGNLIKECGNRVLLFYNLTEEKQDQSVTKLLSLLKTIPQRCTHDMFDRMNEEIERLTNAEVALVLKKTIHTKLDMMIDHLERISKSKGNRDQVLREIEDVKSQAQCLKKQLNKQDNESADGSHLNKRNVSIMAHAMSQDEAGGVPMEVEKAERNCTALGDAEEGAIGEYEDVPSQKQVPRNILLLGTSGRGRSSTGNSICGQNLFKPSDNASAKTDILVKKSVKRDNRNITVFDGLTLPDIRMSKFDAEKQAEDLLRKCFAECVDGFDLLVFVLSYDSRVTEEEQIAVATFRKMFGGSVFSDHCLLIFTHGENFNLQQQKRGKISFKQWLRSTQADLLKKVISDCGPNALLFCNESPELMNEPLRQFFEILDIVPEKITLK